MKRGRHDLFFGVSISVLVLLYLMSSTDLIIHEKKVEIYPVSVIVEDTSDEDHEKLRKGMDRAAEEFHVDLSFITLYERNDQEQQISLIAREISDGAEAVILSPARPSDAIARLDGMVLNSPLIILGERFPLNQAADGISIDYMEDGKMLGDAVRQNPSDIPVYLLTEGLDCGYAQEISDGIWQALEGSDYQIRYHILQAEDDCRKLIEELVYPHPQRAVLVALDEKSLEKAAGILAESNVYSQQTQGLYGIGGTNRVLNYLDQGIIKGLVVHNWFDEGYLSVEKAVKAIQEGGGEREQITMEAYYITREDLRDPRYEKMLYPID